MSSHRVPAGTGGDQPDAPPPPSTFTAATSSRKVLSFDGCVTCRLRKKKCDMATLVCEACRRLNLECIPPSKKRPAFLKSPSVVAQIRLDLKAFLGSQGKLANMRKAGSSLDPANRARPNEPSAEDHRPAPMFRFDKYRNALDADGEEDESEPSGLTAGLSSVPLPGSLSLSSTPGPGPATIKGKAKDLRPNAGMTDGVNAGTGPGTGTGTAKGKGRGKAKATKAGTGTERPTAEVPRADSSGSWWSSPPSSSTRSSSGSLQVRQPQPQPQPQPRPYSRPESYAHPFSLNNMRDPNLPGSSARTFDPASSSSSSLSSALASTSTSTSPSLFSYASSSLVPVKSQYSPRPIRSTSQPSTSAERTARAPSWFPYQQPTYDRVVSVSNSHPNSHPNSNSNHHLNSHPYSQGFPSDYQPVDSSVHQQASYLPPPDTNLPIDSSATFDYRQNEQPVWRPAVSRTQVSGWTDHEVYGAPGSGSPSGFHLSSGYGPSTSDPSSSLPTPATATRTTQMIPVEGSTGMDISRRQPSNTYWTTGLEPSMVYQPNSHPNSGPYRPVVNEQYNWLQDHSYPIDLPTSSSSETTLSTPVEAAAYSDRPATMPSMTMMPSSFLPTSTPASAQTQAEAQIQPQTQMFFPDPYLYPSPSPSLHQRQQQQIQDEMPISGRPFQSSSQNNIQQPSPGPQIDGHLFVESGRSTGQATNHQAREQIQPQVDGDRRSIVAGHEIPDGQPDGSIVGGIATGRVRSERDRMGHTE